MVDHLGLEYRPLAKLRTPVSAHPPATPSAGLSFAAPPGPPAPTPSANAIFLVVRRLRLKRSLGGLGVLGFVQ